MAVELSPHVLVNTIEDNLRRVTKREVAKATDAVLLRTLLGHISTNGLIDGGVSNCAVTTADVRLPRQSTVSPRPR
jgi:hypothetical protein